ncbi:hypothetical protein, conserved [Eimeria necatrix]|uniref:Mediator complex subunit 18 n=1 Tax=Eimeria necatrix TaxID=51315 RepID=U6N914_9EIME|nr:hypothetical protein, conserved [Eimeria necatrix]CDJ70361.1 hypothetical protein, conserved [Eimeria necatrix]
MASLFAGWEDADENGQAADTPQTPSIYTEMRLRGVIKTPEEYKKLVAFCSSTADGVWTCGSVQRHRKSVLYYRDQGVLVGGLQARRAAEVQQVVAVETTQAMRGLLGALGFRRVGSVHVKADVFHFKPKTGRHVVLLLQQHFLDRAHQRPLWGENSCWLVELHARRSSEAAIAAAEAALTAVAEALQPIVTLRKVDPKDYAEAESRAMQAAAV